MGYTHYWQINQVLGEVGFRAFQADVRKLIETGDKDRIIANAVGDAGTKAQFGLSFVAFNGVDEDSHESFWFANGAEWVFCKTARKPYDLFVAASLLIAKIHYGAKISISSDGSIYGDHEWVNATKLVRRVFGPDYLTDEVVDGIFNEGSAQAVDESAEVEVVVAQEGAIKMKLYQAFHIRGWAHEGSEARALGVFTSKEKAQSAISKYEEANQDKRDYADVFEGKIVECEIDVEIENPEII